MHVKRYHIYTFLSTLLLSGCVVSPVPDNYVPTIESHYLEVDKAVLHYGSSGGQETVKVTSSQNWAFSGHAEWVSISPESGSGDSSATIKATENFSGDYGRTSIFDLSTKDAGWEFMHKMSAEQAAAVPFITPEKTNVTFSGASNNLRIPVSSNTEWTASGAESWLTYTAATDRSYIDLSVPENTTNASRQTSITLTGSTTCVITIVQNAAKISAETQAFEFGQAGGTYKVKITSEATWSSATSQSWVEMNPSAGNAGTTEVTISTVANWNTTERTGYIDLKIGNKSLVSMTIKQEPVVLKTETSMSFAAAGEKKTAEVTSNIAWNVLSSPSWLTATPESSNGNGTLSLTASNNPNGTNRTGKVVLGKEGLSHTATIEVTQLGKTLSLSSSVLQFSDKAGSKDVNVTTNGTWVASTLMAWMRPTPASNTGDSVLTVNVDENTNTSERSGDMSVVVDNLSANIAVSQQGKYFTVDNELLTISSKGGKLQVSMSTNEKWTASIENGAKWITLSKTSGENDAVLELTASDNASVNQRSDVLVLTPEYSQAVRVIIRQSPRYLRVDTESFYFFSKGGTSEVATIETDGTYSITSDVDWVSVTQGAGTSFTVTAVKNETGHVREGKVKVALTGLVEGTMEIEIPVVQNSPGGNFGRDDFGNDGNWDDNHNSSATINIDDFGNDNNWDEGGKHTITIEIVGYKADQNWDENGKHSITVTITGYKEDTNWDENGNNTGNVGKDDYGNDNNWDNDEK